MQQQRQCPHTEIALRAVASSSTDRFDALQRDDVELGAALESFDGRVVIDARPDTELRKRALFVKDYLQIPYSKRTIFQKYVFLNPGLFMGIFTSLLLVLIAYYGISNLVGLQTPTRFESNKKKN